MPVSVSAGELCELCLFLLKLQLEANRGQEGFKVVEQILLSHTSVEVEQVQQLSLHQVDLRQAESESFETFDGSVSCPMLVLRAGVVQVLRSKNQRSQEDAVNCTSHAFRHGRQS